MKINDFTDTSDITEAPAGIVGQAAKRIGAKAAGAIGMKGTAAKLGGGADTGKEANVLKTALNKYLGQTGKSMKELTGQDLGAFLKRQRYPAGHIANVDGVLQPKQIDQALLKAVQDANLAPGSSSGKPEPGVNQRKSVPNTGSASNGKQLPPKLAAQINKLTPAQKQQLANLL